MNLSSLRAYISKISAGQLMSFLLMLCIGPSFVTGGQNILFSYILALMGICFCVRGQGVKLSPAAIYVSFVSVIYYLYFAWRIVDTGLDARAVRFLHESIILLLVPGIFAAANKFDLDWIVRWSANLLLPAVIVLLIGVMIERAWLGHQRVLFNAHHVLILAVLIVSGVHFSLLDWKNRGARWRWGAALAWIIGLFVVVEFTQSRAAFVLYFLALGVFLCYLFCSVNYGWRRNFLVLMGMSALLVFLIAGMFLMIMETDVFGRFRAPILALLNGDIKALDLSSLMRLEMWALGWEEIKENPLWGYGPQNTFEVISNGWTRDYMLGHMHNDFMNHLVGGGWIGAGIFILLLISPLMVLMINKSRDDQVIYVAILAFVLVFFAGLSARVYFRPVLIHWAVLTYVFVVLMSDARQRSAIGTKARKG